MKKILLMVTFVVATAFMLFGCSNNQYETPVMESEQIQETDEKSPPTVGLEKNDDAADEQAIQETEKQHTKENFLNSLGTMSVAKIEIQGKSYSLGSQFDNCESALENFNKFYPNAIDDFTQSIKQSNPELFTDTETTFPHLKDLATITDYEEMLNYSIVTTTSYINVNRGVVDSNILDFLHFYVLSHLNRTVMEFIESSQPNSMSDSELEEFMEIIDTMIPQI